MLAGLLGAATATVAVAAGAPDGPERPLQVRDGGIADVLPGAVAGDAGRGRALVADRKVGLCLLCHSGPFPEERFQGNLAPDLAGAGDRSTAAQLRLRIADAGSLNPETIMPSYYRAAGLNRVSSAYLGKSILDAQQIEDIVAYLQTLKAAPDSEAGREPGEASPR